MIPLTLLPHDGGSRVRRDRLELVTTLMASPGFDPLWVSDVIEVPRRHPVFGWGCRVDRCACAAMDRGLCDGHRKLWRSAKEAGVSLTEFTHTAEPFTVTIGIDPGVCRVCPERPARNREPGLCKRHDDRWRINLASPDGTPELDQWLAKQEPFPGYGVCRAPVCPYLAATPLGLCPLHLTRYRHEGCPGGAVLPPGWPAALEPKGLHIPVHYDDEAEFRRWCATTGPARRTGVLNLVGLHPLVKAELQWGLHAHGQVRNHSKWSLHGVQQTADYCRRSRLTTLFDSTCDQQAASELRGHYDARVRMIVKEITDRLRCVYYSPRDTKDAGFIETDHFGRRFKGAYSTFDLSAVAQRWLRDLLWDHLADVLSSTRCPRTRGTFDNLRRACLELGAFLEIDAPQGGHVPHLLDAEHARRFVADQRHRSRHGLPSLGLVRSDGQASTVTEVTRRIVFTSLRKVLFVALESGRAEDIGLGRDFITVLPYGGSDPKKPRGPFSDDVAKALAAETNLDRLSAEHDPKDRGMREVWETIVYTGRRCSEVLELRLDCIGRYRGLPMLWHDQTKVGNYNEAIRIPEVLYTRLDQRRSKTLARFEGRHGRQPTAQERARMALFPSDIRNIDEDRSLSYGHFNLTFRTWVAGLDLGRAVVPHQARHSLATNLLRAGASLAHIRRYLGHVSDRMAEHYTKIAHTDLEDVLHAVWVAGPGAPSPGELLSDTTTPLSRDEALALALDLTRRSTPAEGGFCTFQPVVDGGACPWNLNCENCDKFVLSGADLLYWRRKQEQWRSLAERAPDDATADYLHQAFEPTARAIEGLEKALAGVGLLDQALALDLRRPQDYFARIWSIAFRATDLADVAAVEDQDQEPAR